jgi:hypothetical protein
MPFSTSPLFPVPPPSPPPSPIPSILGSPPPSRPPWPPIPLIFGSPSPPHSPVASPPPPRAPSPEPYYFRSPPTPPSPEPERIVGIRTIGRRRRQYLVKWIDRDHADNTWEDARDWDYPELVDEYEAEVRARETPEPVPDRRPPPPAVILGAFKQRGTFFYEVRMVDTGAIAIMSGEEVRKAYAFEAIEFLERIGDDALEKDPSYDPRPSGAPGKTRSKSPRGGRRS